MGRVPLILLLSWVCAGCTTRLASLDAPPAPIARTLRIVASDPVAARAVTRSLIAAVPFEARDLGGVRGAGCHRLVVSGRDDTTRTGAFVVSAWEAGLAIASGPHAWLLHPLEGVPERTLGATGRVAGLRAEPAAVEICMTRSTPDLAARLQHPALWPLALDGSDGGGLFRPSGDGVSLLRTSAARSKRGIVRVEIRETASHGEIGGEGADPFDLALLSARAAERVLARGEREFRMERTPRWDAVYALWMHDRARWTNDPVFRRWVAAVVDRGAMASYLFGEQAVVANALTGDATTIEAPERRPFSRHSRPRLTLAFDEADRAAASIAARLMAALGQEGAELRLAPGSAAEVRAAIDAGRAQMAIIVHRPPLDDPVLALLDTIWPLRATAGGVAQRLLRASAIESAHVRRARAAEIESEVIASARLLPLIRLQAWAARLHTLEGVELGPFGVVRLEHAEWSR